MHTIRISAVRDERSLEEKHRLTFTNVNGWVKSQMDVDAPDRGGNRQQAPIVACSLRSGLNWLLTKQKVCCLSY